MLRYLILLTLALLTLASAAPAQIQTYTSSKTDGLAIDKITPRVAADLPLPSTFNYTLELKVAVVAVPSATLEVRFERGRVGAKKRTTVAPTIRRTLRQGKQRLVLTSGTIQIGAEQRMNEKLWVTAVLKDPKGREISHSTSTNRLAGTLSLRPNPAAPTVDKIEELSATPGRNDVVPVATTTTFLVRFYYSVKSVRQAFVNIEVGDVAQLLSGTCWYSAVVPLPQGTGIAEVRLQKFFPNFYEGRTFGIFLPLRLEPLGPSKSILEIKPLTFGKARQ